VNNNTVDTRKRQTTKKKKQKNKKKLKKQTKFKKTPSVNSLDVFFVFFVCNSNHCCFLSRSENFTY